MPVDLARSSYPRSAQLILPVDEVHGGRRKTGPHEHRLKPLLH